ncbi:MAG TPA: alanine--tRNA ligase [Actinomycetes bacterium]|nr:alanine--tRNA ligase [Actinomycetes bacterium]
MNSTEIRRRFLDFFVERDHRLVPSSSLIPNDPTLLLANAGMNQFKPYFLGEVDPDFSRATSVQKCFRTSDIENVGHTTRHLTFFEMLGNFSFGDYFKAGAIQYAYELVTERFGFEADRVWATVYLDDDEAFGLWHEVGLPAERIQRRGREDNFWDMGVAGPCGPSSEIYIDRGPDYGREGGPIADEERYLEIWNLVFMQNLRDDKEDYNIVGELPKKNIDTGMGLERVAILRQGVDNVFETDLLAPILEQVQSACGRVYGRDETADLSLRVVAEHTRAASFLIADGVLPSNEGRGYVLRRLLRRAVDHSRRLGVEDPVMASISGSVVDTLGGAWPELVAQRSLIDQVVASEEESFARTLRQGSALLQSVITRTRERGEQTLPGDTAFQLHDTYGFPFELTVEVATDAGLQVDRERFGALMEEQRRRGKEARREMVGAQRKVEAYRELSQRFGRTAFVGYDRTSAEGRVLGLLGPDGEELSSAAQGQDIELVLDRTPFYAESGGQVGDKGVVRTSDGAVLQVTDTQFGLEGFHVHTAKVLEGELRSDEPVLAEVDPERRAATARSHTATHTLHWALRQKLGDHAKQQGSLVDAGRLRFDFAHFSSVPAEHLAGVQDDVNLHLAGDPEVKVWHTSLAEAEASGAVGLFGEKYGAVVRVVDIGDFSRELCGGTHVGHGSQVGPVLILGESSVGANLRRIEALTGLDALRHLDRERQLLAEVASLLRARPEDAPEQLRRRLEALADATRELQRLRQSELAGRAAELAGHATTTAGGAWMVVERVAGANADELRQLANTIRERRGGGPGVVVLGSDQGGRGNLVALVTADLVGRGVTARDVVMPAARLVGGGAGGKGELATGGGADAGKLDEALATARTEANRVLTEGSGEPRGGAPVDREGGT